MNFKIGSSGFAAAALGALLLSGCDSIKDVRDQPYTGLPEHRAPLAGTVTGLGTARAVALSYDGELNCLAPDPANPAVRIPATCKFFGAAGQNEVNFSFGSFDVGTPYDITVQTQPYGKTCTVANASGTVGSGAPPPQVTCVNDPGVSRHDLTVNIAPAVQSSVDNLWVRLATEDGVQVVDATDLTSVSFPDALLDSGTNLPAFLYKVTAYTESATGSATTANLCTFTSGASFNQGGENRTSTDAVVVPNADTSVTVNSCAFTVTATVQYNGTPAQALPGTGMEIGLKNHFTGEIEQTLPVAAFTAGAATVSFPTALRAHSKSIYELVVTRQPVGQHCIVIGTTTTNADTTSTTAGMTSNIVASTAGAVLLVDPGNSDWWAFASRGVRCRAIPAAANQLTGTYQMDARTGTQADTDPPLPYGRPREFLTFFADGTFMYGINMNSASTSNLSPNATFPGTAPVRNNFSASSGLVHGFYAYNAAAGTMVFTILTATNTNPAGRGLNGMPGFQAAGGGAAVATGTVPSTAATLTVAKTAPPDSTLSLTFTSGTTTRQWTMTEPLSIAGEVSGTWVTEDHRRVMTYDKGTTYIFHVGVNGLGNLQDTCFIVADGSTQSGGIITRHASSATAVNSSGTTVFTCTPGVVNPGAAGAFARTPDLPHYAVKNTTAGLAGPTTPRIAPGFNGRFPGSASQLDNRPGSPVLFEVAAGNPDTLTVQETLNGTPTGQPVVFVRERAN